MKFLGWIIALPLIALALYAAARMMMCKPDREVVRVATPMAEKIADYIVKHGVPKSLKDIPNLPYELEGCEVSVKYEKKVNDKFIKANSENEADYILHEQSCSFYQKDKAYRVWLHLQKLKNFIQGDLDIRYEKTTVGTIFKMKNGHLFREVVGTGFDNRFGFCAALKQ